MCLPICSHSCDSATFEHPISLQVLIHHHPEWIANHHFYHVWCLHVRQLLFVNDALSLHLPPPRLFPNYFSLIVVDFAQSCFHYILSSFFLNARIDRMHGKNKYSSFLISAANEENHKYITPPMPLHIDGLDKTLKTVFGHKYESTTPYQGTSHWKSQHHFCITDNACCWTNITVVRATIFESQIGSTTQACSITFYDVMKASLHW